MLEQLKITYDELIFEQRNDPAWQFIIEKCLENNQGHFFREFVIENEILYKVDKLKGHYLLVVPFTLIEKVLSLYHDNDLVVHLSQSRLYNFIRTRFYWNNLDQDVCDWVDS